MLVEGASIDRHVQEALVSSAVWVVVEEEEEEEEGVKPPFTFTCLEFM